jgi:hypothetical protein
MQSKPVPGSSPKDEPDYDNFLQRIQVWFMDRLALGGGQLFTTDAADLFDAYLSGFDGEERQYHNCHACRQFFERYAGLVVIDDNGVTHSAIFSSPDAPPEYLRAVREVIRAVTEARVTGVFYAKEAILGTPQAGGWRHFFVTQVRPHLEITKTVGHHMAEKLEDHKNVLRALNEFSIPNLEQAVRLLDADQLYRAEALLGGAKWLLAQAQVQAQAQTHRGRSIYKTNLLWRAITLAPAGFCHPRAGMLGTLLEDLQEGLPFDDVKRRFDAKMHPLRYQRPQAPPSVGTVQQAEKLFEQMGLAPALKRRLATMEDLECLWKSTEEQPAGTGLFGHLKTKGASSSAPVVDTPVITMTWEKFQRKVLPLAEKIEFHVPPTNAGFCQLVTAVDPSAPPIVYWDAMAHRNPVSWYVYDNGSRPTQFGLTVNAWTVVEAVTLQPNTWAGNFGHTGEAVIFALRGCRDKDYMSAGLGLFPSILRSELHGVRSVIEAFSRDGKIQDTEFSVAGIRLSKGENFGRHARFRVLSGGAWQVYDLDRWD